jgi:hypothetical protein
MAISRRLSFVLAAVAGGTGIVSFVWWRLFLRDVPAGIGNLRGTALTLVVLVIPLMLLAMRAAAAGSMRGRLIWLACLAYIAYNAVMFCFAAHFNALFLAFTSVLTLSFWSMVTLIPTIDRARLAQASARMPVRPLGAYLVMCMVLFAGLWLRSIVPATLSNEMPQLILEAGLTQNTVWVLDFAFSFPLMGLGARWLWQRKPFGYLVGGMMILMLTLETAGVAIDQWFGHLHDPAAPLATIPVMLGFTAAGLVFSALFLRGIAPTASLFPVGGLAEPRQVVAQR